MYRILSYLLLCFLAVGPILFAAQTEPPLIPREIIFGNPEKSSPQLSPDGKRLAYLAPDDKNVMNVWVRELDTPNSDKLITSDKIRGIQSYMWQFDNANILYVQDKDGNENWHLYQTNIDNKSTRDLTPFEGVRASPLSYLPQYPNDMLIQLNLRDPALFEVYHLNLTDGKLDLDTPNTENVNQWLADDHLKVRASQLYDKNGDTIMRVREDEKSPWKELLRTGPLESEESLVSFSHDGNTLYIVSSSGANTGRLVAVDVHTGKQKVIAEDPRYDLSDVLTHPLTNDIEAVAVERDRYEWILLNPALSQDFTYLSKDTGDFHILSRDLNDKKWVVAYIYDNKPAQFYLYDRAKKQKEFLFTSRPKLEKYTLSKMTPVSFTARDGMKLYGYLTLPAGKEPKNLSTVLLVHGGPWVRDSWGFSAGAQWLANRGYAVLQLNYRGSSGYGKDYLNAGNREWAGKMQTDLVDGKEWLVKQGYANPDKVAIYGGSYGGYATLVALTFTPNEFCCGVDIVGPSNLVTLLQTVPPYWGPMKSRFDIRVGKLDTEQEFLESRSPLFKADKITKPLLIGQGANDPRVKQAESDQIVAAMRKNGKPVEYLLFKDEGHGFTRPENRLKFFAATEQFLAKYLGGRSQAPLPEENYDDVKQ